jgi:hypothetical protein
MSDGVRAGIIVDQNGPFELTKPQPFKFRRVTAKI